jgi:hypothetical protein
MNANVIGSTARQLIIQKVVPEEVEEGAPPKPVVYFMSEPLGLPLNKTNLNFLIGTFGGESDAWVGKTVEVFTMPVQYSGRMMQGVRMRVPSAPSQEALATDVPHSVEAGLDYTA